MYSGKDLTDEARKLIEDKLRHKQTIKLSWAVKELIDQRGNIDDPTGYFRFCAIETSKRFVKQAIARYDSNADDGSDQQIEILYPGFEYVRQAYSFERDGELVLIPTDNVPDEELLNRADQFDVQAKGLRAHAQEIRDFVGRRRANIA